MQDAREQRGHAPAGNLGCGTYLWRGAGADRCCEEGLRHPGCHGELLELRWRQRPQRRRQLWRLQPRGGHHCERACRTPHALSNHHWRRRRASARGCAAGRWASGRTAGGGGAGGEDAGDGVEGGARGRRHRRAGIALIRLFVALPYRRDELHAMMRTMSEWCQWARAHVASGARRARRARGAARGAARGQRTDWSSSSAELLQLMGPAGSTARTPLVGAITLSVTHTPWCLPPHVPARTRRCRICKHTGASVQALPAHAVSRSPCCWATARAWIPNGEL